LDFQAVRKIKIRSFKMEEVILVDEMDNATGTMEKMEAHEKGVLHRAFSIFIFNAKGEMLLQRRALNKYHSGGLWTNACCSHPRPGEETMPAAKRRLMEEMGLKVELQTKTSFVYKAHFSNSLTEYEFDHVLIGYTDENPRINPAEVESYQWITINKIKEQISTDPDAYTAWFKIAMEKLF
jgi:isopentenyl-diphosphate Delta-isomerase